MDPSPPLSSLLSHLSSHLLVVVFRRPRQRSEWLTSVPSPPSTPERGQDEPIPSVSDRRSLPIQDQNLAPTVPTLLKTHSRAGGISQFPPSLSVPRALEHDTPTRLPIPLFLETSTSYAAAFHRTAIAQRSTDRLHFNALHCPLVFSAFPSARVNALTSTRRKSAIHQLGSLHRQVPRKLANSGIWVLDSAELIRPAIPWAGPGKVIV
jgi:hypothetical protein